MQKAITTALLLSATVFFGQNKKCFPKYEREINSLINLKEINFSKRSFNKMLVSCESRPTKIAKLQRKILESGWYKVVEKDSLPFKKGMLVEQLVKMQEEPEVNFAVSPETQTKISKLLAEKIYDTVKPIEFSSYFLVSKNYKYGIADSDFLEILPIEFDRFVSKGDYLIVTKDGKQSLFGLNEKKLTLPFYREIVSSFHISEKNDRQFFEIYKTHNHDMGLFYGDGTPIVDFPKENVEQNIYVYDNEGIIVVRRDKEPDEILNLEGKILISNIKILNDLIQENLFIVQNSDGESALINLKNEQILPYSDAEITHWGDYFLLEKNGYKGIADRNGNVIIPIIYENIGMEHYDTFVVKINGKYGLLNKFNDFVIEPKYDDLDVDLSDEIYREFLFSKENGKSGVLNVRGETIIPAKYDQIGIACYEEVYFLLVENGKHGIANKFGKVVVLPIYDNLKSENIRDGKVESFIFEENGKQITVKNPDYK